MALKNNDLVNQESKKFMEKMMAALQENDAEGAAKVMQGNAGQHLPDHRAGI